MESCAPGIAVAAASRLTAGAETHAPWVWVNGGLVKSETLRVHYFTHALHYGSAVFEGIRCYDTPAGPALFRLDDHMRRLLASSRVYGMRLPYDAEALVAAAREVVRANRVRNAYVRPLAFYGEGPIHLTPRSTCPVEAFIAARPLGAYLGDEGIARGIRVILSSWRKFDRTMLPPAVKGSGHYTNSILAAQEAAERGAAEAILLNADGSVAEATGENVFFVKDGLLVTNDASSNILPGITRDSVLRLARDLGIPIAIRPFGPAELFAADEVLLTGTAAEVTPVAVIDDRPLPPRPADGVTARLQRLYFDCVRGRAPLYSEWLTHV
jgi:branched-chain amino acid aminotransferase